MEFLKKSLLVLCFFLVIQVDAQDTKTLQIAFEKSYSLESKYLYDDAIRVIKENYSEKSYPVNTRLGWLYYLNKNYTSSIYYYKKACQLMPAATEPLWALLSPEIGAEKWSDVEKTYLKIIKLDPKNASANYKLGMIYYYRKNYSKAKKYFDVSLNLYPLDYDSMNMSAWTNFYLGNSNDAKIMFKKILLVYPNDATALEGLGLIK